jgi:hypothetical protein
MTIILKQVKKGNHIKCFIKTRESSKRSNGLKIERK